jgi:hypothetical protein
MQDGLEWGRISATISDFMQFLHANTLAGILDEPFLNSKRSPLSGVAVQACRAGTVSNLCSLAGWNGYSTERRLS